MRLRVGIPNEIRITSLMPQGEWQDAHERAVAVGVLVVWAGSVWRNTREQRANRLTGLNTDIKNHIVDGKIAGLIPGDEALSKICKVKRAMLK